MTLLRYAALTVLAVAITSGPAFAFGRGVAARGAAVGGGGGIRTGGMAAGTHVGPAGGIQTGNIHGGSYSGPGGSTVQHIGGHGTEVGPFGGVHTGGGGATRVTGPGGNTYTTGHHAGATVGPAGGVAIGGGRGAVANGPNGFAAGGSRGGIAVGPGGGVAAGGSRGGMAVGPGGGVIAGGSRGGAVATPWGGVAAGGYRGGIAVGAGGAAVAGGTRVYGHTTGYYSPSVMRSSAVAVRSGGYYPYFNRGWYTAHAGAWYGARWVSGYNLWVAPAYATLAGFVGADLTPAVYDYGSTVVVSDSDVYVNGESVGTPELYAAQAETIADSGRTTMPADTDEWQPLGVFGLVQPEETVAQRIFQLAVNKAGVVRGNYYDAVGDTTTPVYGSVDKATQRVAWSIGEKKDIVFETGLSNLTKDESSVLIHYGKERTEQQMLVRIPQPKDGM
jgi:hypothetical protein